MWNNFPTLAKKSEVETYPSGFNLWKSSVSHQNDQSTQDWISRETWLDHKLQKFNLGSDWDNPANLVPWADICSDASFLPFRTDQGLPWAFGIVGLSSVSGRCEKMGFGQELAPLLSPRPAHYSEHNHQDYGSPRYLPHFDPFYCLLNELMWKMPLKPIHLFRRP